MDIVSTLQQLLIAENSSPFERYQRLITGIVSSDWARIGFQDTCDDQGKSSDLKNRPEDMLQQDLEIGKYFPFGH